MFDALAKPLAGLLSRYYELVPNYAVAIAMLTVTVMILLLPLTIKGTRSMMAMQRLAPELKKLQDKHKNDREKLNAEVMALYRDNKITPLGGCFPILLQMPVFFVMYQVLNGLTRTTDGVPNPKYISHTSELYQALMASNGQMMSFGIDLSESATRVAGGLVDALPYYMLIVLMVVFQYIQQWQITSRAPSADTPQAQQMRTLQKFFPPFIGVFSIGFPAGLVLYWTYQNLFRIGQQWAMYRFDPVLKSTIKSAKKEAEQFLAEDDSPRTQKKGTDSSQSKKSTGSKNQSNKKKRKGR